MANIFDSARDLYEKSISNKIGSDELDTIINWPIESISVLFACADQVRNHFCQNTVDPCALMNIKSGGCSEDCAFCAQSSHNETKVNIRDLATPEEIKEQFEKANAKGLPFCVVSSGRRLSIDEIKVVTNALKDCHGEKHASLGILGKDEFALLRDAGVVCYNHNIETSRRFYPKIVSTHIYDDRIATVKRAKDAGLSVCCGGIFGMGETWEDRKDMCLELKALDVDTVPINFLNAIPGTRVSKPEETPLELLKIVSMFRIAMPSKTIKVCGGREVNLGPLQSLIFYAGANGYVSGGYLTTAGAGVDADDTMIEQFGFVKKLQK